MAASMCQFSLTKIWLATNWVSLLEHAPTVVTLLIGRRA